MWLVESPHRQGPGGTLSCLQNRIGSNAHPGLMLSGSVLRFHFTPMRRQQKATHTFACEDRLSSHVPTAQLLLCCSDPSISRPASTASLTGMSKHKTWLAIS